MAVFVLGKHKEPLMPCSEKRARLLLERGRARIHRMYPFTIRLIDREGGALQPLTLKLDPGAKQTGVAIVRQAETTAAVVALIEIKHRGATIRKALQQRAAFRRRRRSSKLRYRAPRFDNRRKPEGWLAPSLRHRVDTVMATVARLQHLAPVAAIVQELVRFDMQMMENPEISGVEYQRGTLVGCEVREYLLAKWGRKCAYCDAENVPLNLDHVQPRSRGGSSRVTNLVPACVPCNRTKDDRGVEEFLSRRSKPSGQDQKPDQIAAQGCRGGERDTLGALPRAGGHGPSDLDRQRRTNEVQPAPARDPEGSRSRCGLCRQHGLDYSRTRLGAANACDLSQWARVLQADPAHGPRISARLPHAEQIGARVYDR